MSLPDCQLDLPEEALCECGELALPGREVCAGCRADSIDLYADEEMSERLTNRRKR
jgi:hypothetical protein